jgi:hypothetical protein
MDWVKGGGDTYSHFILARDALIYPENLLHHWGKPFFTLVALPFAQLGLKGVEFMNMILNLASGFLAFRIASSLNYRFSSVATLFTLFAPILFITTFSALTEPLATFLLTLGIFLYTHKKFLWGSLTLSFLIMVRTEAFVFYPIWLLFLMWNKAYKAIPFLFFAFVVYSVAGASYYQDMFWVITKQPYGDSASVYGTGNFLHFADSYLKITHKIPALLTLLGLVFLFVHLVKDRFTNWTHQKKTEWLILATASSFFLAHSYAWWVGNAGSAGLLRPMAVIIPCTSILAVKGLNIPFLNNSKRVQQIFWIVILVLSLRFIHQVWQMYQLPVATDPIVACINEIRYPIEADYKKGQKLAYFHPYVNVHFNIDYHNREQAIYLFENGKDRMQELQSGDLIIWDSQHWPVEGQLPKEKMDYSDFELVDRVQKPIDNTKMAEVEVWRKK